MAFTFKLPKDDKRITWTQHAAIKMRQYGVSEQRVRRVLRKPERQEEAIVPGLVAVMQRSSPTAKNPNEIWVMYALASKLKDASAKKQPQIRVISVWRYPGKSPEREAPPIPEDVLREIHQLM